MAYLDKVRSIAREPLEFPATADRKQANEKGAATMRRLKRVETKQQRQVHRVLDLFSRHCTTGILPLCGRACFPDDEVLFEMLQEEYIQRYKANHHGATPERVATKGGSSLAYAQKVVEAADGVKQIIRQAGGLATFTAAFEELAAVTPRNMQIVIDLSRRAGTLETIADIAERYYLSDPQINNIKKNMLTAIAINICGRRLPKGTTAKDNTAAFPRARCEVEADAKQKRRERSDSPNA